MKKNKVIAKRGITKKAMVDPRIKRLGIRMRELRKKKGFTSYDQFAYASNLNRSQIGRYETGEDMYFSSLLKVVDALGLTLKEFFSEGID